jgi:hypothetical protein
LTPLDIVSRRCCGFALAQAAPSRPSHIFMMEHIKI